MGRPDALPGRRLGLPGRDTQGSSACTGDALRGWLPLQRRRIRRIAHPGQSNALYCPPMSMLSTTTSAPAALSALPLAGLLA